MVSFRVRWATPAPDWTPLCHHCTPIAAQQPVHTLIAQPLARIELCFQSPHVGWFRRAPNTFLLSRPAFARHTHYSIHLCNTTKVAPYLY